MFARFSLVLMVNHACNLRCTYCYTGAKFNRPMPRHVAERAIDRAVNSLAPEGTLELGFFGGEPLIEADLIGDLMEFTIARTGRVGAKTRFTLTTNGTIDSAAAWRVMLRPDLRLNISHDGLPEVHDQHRIGTDGSGSSNRVLATIRRLIDAARMFGVVMVVRPDTADRLADGVAWLQDHGVRHVTPSLDIWSKWTRGQLQRLVAAIARCADVWRAGLPRCSVSWFDDKA